MHLCILMWQYLGWVKNVHEEFKMFSMSNSLWMFLHHHILRHALCHATLLYFGWAVIYRDSSVPQVSWFWLDFVNLLNVNSSRPKPWLYDCKIPDCGAHLHWHWELSVEDCVKKHYKRNLVTSISIKTTHKWKYDHSKSNVTWT